MQQQVTVLGLGNWGTAIANLLANNGFTVTGWTIEKEIAEGINTTHRNPIYLSEVELAGSIRATLDIEEALQNSFVVLVLPSAALPDVVPKIKVPADTVLVSAVKGFESNSITTPLQYCRANLPQICKLVVLSGPSFARDIVAGQPAGVVAASDDEQAARQVASVFTGNSLRVYLSSDPLGVELGGILKNVIALAAGVADGIDLGDSARAGLITRGLAEMMRLAKAMGAEVQTLAGLSGLGDLVMTASCNTSRNRTVGLRLGQGESMDHIIKTLGSVAEGVKTTPLVLALAKKYGVEMPISTQVARLINGEIAPEDFGKMYIGRPMKFEFEDL